MVMGRRPGVARSSWPITATDLLGLAGQFAAAMARVPFRRPWSGDGNLPHNLAVTVTREAIRSFMVLVVTPHRRVAVDRVSARRPVRCGPPAAGAFGRCGRTGGLGGRGARHLVPPEAPCRPRHRAVPPRRRLHRHVASDVRPVHGLAGSSYRVRGVRRRSPAGARVSLPGGPGGRRAGARGPARRGRRFLPTHRCRRFERWRTRIIADLFRAPRPSEADRRRGHVLAEVDLLLDQPSISDNAGKDILPWNIPTSAYLHGRNAEDGSVSAVDQDVCGWPPTFVSFGGDEMFRDPIRLFVDHLHAAGVEVVALEEPGMFHVFPILMPWAEGSRLGVRCRGRIRTGPPAGGRG